MITFQIAFQLDEGVPNVVSAENIVLSAVAREAMTQWGVFFFFFVSLSLRACGGTVVPPDPLVGDGGGSLRGIGGASTL